LGNLSTPKTVQKLQKALHAKAKAEAEYRFYALYDKISREDILAYAYALCRSNKGAPGVDGQNFADIDAYGARRWLGELAPALRQETYRPDPIRRVFIPKANGKLRPLGISTVRDRVCMTAAMLVLESFTSGEAFDHRVLLALCPTSGASDLGPFVTHVPTTGYPQCAKSRATATPRIKSVSVLV
jgi:retron-type reverse transcriptase